MIVYLLRLAEGFPIAAYRSYNDLNGRVYQLKQGKRTYSVEEIMVPLSSTDFETNDVLEFYQNKWWKGD
jgi:hypothetical protein